MGMIKLKIEKGKGKVTPFGGIVLIRDLIKGLRIREYIDKNFPKPGPNAGKAASMKIISVILSMICGGRGFSDIEKIREDRVICEIFGFKNMVDISTINRFFNNVGSEALRALYKLSSEIVLKGLRVEGVKEVTIDQDATYTEVYKRDAKRNYKGKKSFSSLMSFIDGYGYCIDEEFREGNVSPGKGLLEQLKRVHSLLKRNNIRLSKFRSDLSGI